MVSRLLQELQASVFGPLSGRNNLFQLFDDGHDDTFDFPHARIVGILIVALVVTQLLNVASRHLSELSKSPRLAVRRKHPADLHTFQRDL